MARADGNYASVGDIAADVRAKLGGGTVGVVFPILLAQPLRRVPEGHSDGREEDSPQLSYPSDEVGNHLFDEDTLDEQGVDPWRDVLTLAEYRRSSAISSTRSPAWTTWNTMSRCYAPPARTAR